MSATPDSGAVEQSHVTSNAGESKQASSGGRLAQLSRQLRRKSPFGGSISPGRVPLFAPFAGRPSLPFPHPWNYHEPLRILDTFFHGADSEQDFGARHNRYLDVPGFMPVLVTRDPAIIKAISAATGDKPGQFDRDTLPIGGIARATGKLTLIASNGAEWRAQKQMAAPPFAKSTLFQPEVFEEFEKTFRRTASERLQAVKQRVRETGKPSLRLELEPEIKAVMLEMLVNNFFGASLTAEQVRNRDVPALDDFVDRIVRDTVVNMVGCPLHKLPRWMRGGVKAEQAKATFERLTDSTLEPRARSAGLWRQFKSDAPDEALKPNIRAFLAGAVEASTSYAAWAISHLARNAEAQQKLFEEVRDVEEYNPDSLKRLPYLGCVLNETMRLTPALYFHPRRPTVDTVIRTDAGQTLHVPRGTHILMDIWHANRHEDHWGVGVTGHPADRFVPERWWGRDATELGTREWMHFGYGHGPRFCPGKNLGQLEVALVVGAVIKLFDVRAVDARGGARAGVSTKPADGVLVDLRVRE
jgi:cytochrome P450